MHKNAKQLSLLLFIIHTSLAPIMVKNKALLCVFVQPHFFGAFYFISMEHKKPNYNNNSCIVIETEVKQWLAELKKPDISNERKTELLTKLEGFLNTLLNFSC